MELFSGREGLQNDVETLRIEKDKNNTLAVEEKHIERTT